MRYVLLVVAIGLLVVGGLAYVAQAAQSKPAAYDSRQLFAPERNSVMDLAADASKMMAARQQTVYRAQVEQLQQQQAQQSAAAAFGQWGPDIMEAAQAYGQDPNRLYDVMMCESKGDPGATNGIVEGLFQFNPGTWASTPYAGQSIFDGHAQVMAAAWMWSQGRIGEWACA